MPRKVILSTEEILIKQDKYNKSISSSLAGILRLSLDTEFRLKCYELMKVDNTNDLETAIKRKLDIQTQVIQSEECLVNDASTSNIEMCNIAEEITHPAEVDNVAFVEESNENEVLSRIGNDLQENTTNLHREDNMEDDVWFEDECFQWTSNNKPQNIVGTQMEQETQEEAADELQLDDVLWN